MTCFSHISRVRKTEELELVAGMAPIVAIENQNNTPNNDLLSLISRVRKIQELEHGIGTVLLPDLPRIVVIGNQGCGKSSVLEGLIGNSFSPCGRGIMTRCPIIVQMIPVKGIQEKQNGTNLMDGDVWAEFGHTNRRFTDFNAIEEEIFAETCRIAGEGRKYSRTLITLKLYSPMVIGLTLVNLPGLIQYSPNGVEDGSSELIRDMTLDYISPQNTIILAVTPATVDILSSESVGLAQTVDPTGSRTVGVISMVDLMQEVDMVKTLIGRVDGVACKIIGVINRSYRDISRGKTIEAAIRDEEEYLRIRYPEIAHFHGINALRNRLHARLIQHVKSNLETVEKAVSVMIAETEMELRELDIGTKDADAAEKKRKVLEKLTALQETAETVSILHRH